MDNVEVFEGKDNQWYYRVKANNGEVLASSEGYSVQASAYKGAEALQRALVDDKGLEAITRERVRVVATKQHKPDADVGRSQELIDAAFCYLGSVYVGGPAVGVGHDKRMLRSWPWAESEWKPESRVRNLEKAGALIAAALSAIAAEEELK